MKVAIVHDWFDKIAGSETIIRELVKCFPDAHVFSLVSRLDDDDRRGLDLDVIHTSFVQKLPLPVWMLRNELPLISMAIGEFDLTGYDLVLSSSYAIAWSGIATSKQLHVTYIQTPFRYDWDMQAESSGNTGLRHGIKSAVARAARQYVQMWDGSTKCHPDVFVANSRLVADRIQEKYDCVASVVFPPVDVESIRAGGERGEFYLAVGHLMSSRRFDLVVKAFANHPDKELIVIGSGDERERLEEIATPNVKIMGFQPAEVLHDHLQRAKAFVSASAEDFGILSVEAQACGTPVIGFAQSGLRDTVIDRRTGLLFAEQSVESVSEAIQDMADLPSDYFDPKAIRGHANSFSAQRFRFEIKSLVKSEFIKRRSALADEIEVLDFNPVDDLGDSIESTTTDVPQPELS